ncbi:MAG: DUF4412 domain-containing protein [Rhodovibrionaceae bacterium]
MTLLCRRLAPLLLCALLLSPGLAGAEDFPKLTTSYSADQLIETTQGDIVSKVYHDGGRQRTEMQLQGMQQISIVRPDQQRIVMVMPQMNMAMEMPFNNELTQRNPEYRIRDYPTEALGRETLQGEEVTKYKVTDPGGSIGHAWVTDDGIFVRMEGGEGQEQVVIQRSNIQRGPQDAALFEPPADVPVTKMDPAMLQQMMQQMQAQ